MDLPFLNQELIPMSLLVLFLLLLG